MRSANHFMIEELNGSRELPGLFGRSVH